MNQVLSQNDQLTSQIFVGFGWVHLPTNLFEPWLDWQASSVSTFPCCQFDFYCACACLPVGPTPTWYQKGWGGLFPLVQFSFQPCIAQCKNFLLPLTCPRDRRSCVLTWARQPCSWDQHCLTRAPRGLQSFLEATAIPCLQPDLSCLDRFSIHIIITPILHMWKMGLRKVKWIFPGFCVAFWHCPSFTNFLGFNFLIYKLR